MSYGAGFGNSARDKMRRKDGIDKNSKTSSKNAVHGGGKGGPKRLKPKGGK
jgi:hypothetical protein